MDGRSLFLVDSDRQARIAISAWAREQGLNCRPFADTPDLLAELDHLSNGIILIDIQNAGYNGFEVIQAVSRRKLASPIIAMCGSADSRVVVEAIRRGAVDFLMKPIVLAELHEAVNAAAQVLESRTSIFEEVERDRKALERLTAREAAVLDAIRQGKTSKVIARDLGISARTVESYRASLASKLGVGSTAEAVAMAVRSNVAMLAHESRVTAARNGAGL